MKQISDALPPARRGKFEHATRILYGDYMEKHPDKGTARNTTPAIRAVFHDKTGNQVMREAETAVQGLIDAEAKRRQTMTSRTFPLAIPVRSEALACEALVSTTIWPSQLQTADIFQISESSLTKPEAEIKRLSAERHLEGGSSIGTDKLAIEIHGKELRFMTTAAVEMGMASSPPFRIIKNDANALAAVDLQEGLLGFTLDSFLLNKTNGLAVWTKSRPISITGPEPDTQTHYLTCR